MIKNLEIGPNSYDYDVECDGCGAGPLKQYGGELECSVPDPRRGGTRDHQTHYDVCLRCLKVGPENFPDRLREYARELQEKAQNLLQLANAEWSSVAGLTYEDIIRKWGEPPPAEWNWGDPPEEW